MMTGCWPAGKGRPRLNAMGREWLMAPMAFFGRAVARWLMRAAMASFGGMRGALIGEVGHQRRETGGEFGVAFEFGDGTEGGDGRRLHSVSGKAFHIIHAGGLQLFDNLSHGN